MGCRAAVPERSRRRSGGGGGGGGAALPAGSGAGGGGEERERGAVRSCGLPSPALAAGEPVLEAPGFAAGLDDVCAVGEPVDDRLREPRGGGDLRPLAEGQVGGDDQGGAFVAFGDHLEDELGGALGQGEGGEPGADQERDAGGG